MDKKVITWNDVVRSTEPLDYKRLLARLTFTPKDLARALNQFVEEELDKTKSDPNRGQDGRLRS
jgi:hypothetical protein